MTNIIDTQRILRGESQIEYKPVSPQDKFSVRAATTANIALSGLLTVDGVVLAAGDRVLVKDQTTGSENGIYVAAAGAWSRADDANADTSATKDVVLGKVDPIRGMLQGKLQVSGDLPTLAREVQAAKALVNLASSVTTSFPDEE